MTTTESPTGALPEPEEIDPDEPRPAIEVEATDTPAPEEPHLPAVVERPRPLVPGQDIPIIPAHQEMQGMAAMAVTLAGADAVPVALRNKPNDVFQVLLTARDLGVAITTGMREFHVIDGKVTLSPKVKLAMVNERGRQEGWACWPDPGNDAETATWHATRRDRPGLTFSSSFTMAEARNVKISSTKTLDGKDNWQNYPKRMLSWRALGYLLDDVFPEVGTGLYSPDELGAMTDEDGQVIDVSSTEPLAGTKAPRGHGTAAPDPQSAWLREAEPEFHADLGRRIAAITAGHADARKAALALWNKEDDPLPVPNDLQVRHGMKAKARLQSVEALIRRGEYGQDALDRWTDATEGHEPPAAPASDVPGAAGDVDTPETGGATTAPVEMGDVADERTVPAAIWEIVTDLPPDQVTVQLFNDEWGWSDEMGDPPSNIGDQRRALARLMHDRNLREIRETLDQQVEDARAARRSNG